MPQQVPWQVKELPSGLRPSLALGSAHGRCRAIFSDSMGKEPLYVSNWRDGVLVLATKNETKGWSLRRARRGPLWPCVQRPR